MSIYDSVIVERYGSVAVVSLNRPDNLNSFNKTLRRDLLLAVREACGWWWLQVQVEPLVPVLIWRMCQWIAPLFELRISLMASTSRY